MSTYLYSLQTENENWNCSFIRINRATIWKVIFSWKDVCNKRLQGSRPALFKIHSMKIFWFKDIHTADKFTQPCSEKSSPLTEPRIIQLNSFSLKSAAALSESGYDQAELESLNKCRSAKRKWFKRGKVLFVLYTHAFGSVLMDMEIWLIWSSQAARHGTLVPLSCLMVLNSPSCPNTSFMHSRLGPWSSIRLHLYKWTSSEATPLHFF